MATTRFSLVLAASLGLLILASAGMGALAGARWAARRRPAPEPAAAPSGKDACPGDDRLVASLWARVRYLEERLAAVNAPPLAVVEEAEPSTTGEAAAPLEAAAASPPPAPTPPLVVASKLFENEWSRDAEARLVEAAAREAGDTGQKAEVACTHDECRVELTDAGGVLAGQRAHKILSEVSLYLPHADVVSDETTGKTTIVVARMPTAPPG
jgi:hypothetical protein